MKMQNRRDPRTLPCRTPVCVVPTAGSLPFVHTDCDLSERYNWKKNRMTEGLLKYACTFCCKIV